MHHHPTHQATTGFTLLELMIVIAVIGILASIAVPILGGAKKNANEAAVLHTLKAIAAAQVEIQVAGEIDVDQNGTGEYGFLGELAGVTNIRADESGALTSFEPAGVFDGVFRRTPVRTQSAAARVLPQRITPAPLSIQFGDITNGRLQRRGYLFQVCLPSSSGVPQSESTFGGAADISVGAQQAENFWCCYAWPVKYGQTGTRCFFMNETGEVYSASNTLRYSGHDDPPPELAAYSGANMASGVDAKGTGVDGQSWRLGMVASVVAASDDEGAAADDGEGDSGSASASELKKARRQARRAANVATRREKRAANTKKRAAIAATRAAAAAAKSEKAAAAAAAKGDKRSKRLAKRAANQARAAERAAQNAAKQASKAATAATAARAQANKLAEKYAAMK